MWGNYYYEITIMLLRATLKKKKIETTQLFDRQGC